MKENNVSRRDFVKTLGVVGVGSVIGAGQALAQSNAPSAAGAPAPVKPVKIPTRAFGRTGVPVSMLALGGIFDTVSNQLVLKQALDWGVNYWDTAAGYGNGASETGIGMYLEKNPQARRDIFLVTKSHGGGTEGMTKALNLSLERLKTDYIDLYFVHGPDNTSEFTPEMKAWAEKAKADKDKDKEPPSNPMLADTVNKLAAVGTSNSFSRGKGTVFLVDAKSRQVVWSVYHLAKGSSAKELDRTASDIVSRLKRDLKGK